MAPCPAGAVTQRYPADMSKYKTPFRLRTLSVSVAATSALVSSMALAAEPTASACTDFYTHINGQWIANTELPPDRARIGSFDQLAISNTRLLIRSLDRLLAQPQQQNTPCTLYTSDAADQ